jgi:hypothetical protein
VRVVPGGMGLLWHRESEKSLAGRKSAVVCNSKPREI